MNSKVNETQIEESIYQELKTIAEECFNEDKIIQTAKENYGIDFKIDQKNKNVVKELLLYFSNNKKCIYNISKGILIIGGVGTGKTLLFKLILDLIINYKVYSNKICDQKYDEIKDWYDSIKNIQIEDRIRDEAYWHNVNKFMYWQKFRDKVNNSRIEKFEFILVRKFALNYGGVNDPSFLDYNHDISCCLDDLGLVPRGYNQYGHYNDFIGEFLLDRYEAYTKDRIYKTFATSNYDVETLKTIFGPRIISRMREIFNIIVLDGKDRRQ